MALVKPRHHAPAELRATRARRRGRGEAEGYVWKGKRARKVISW
ncbi:hypothetical protein E2C01_100078 [Portunus trituberculatus]|uniref:Uncharacterized protein n=1 Tax=Portunus trituberculatus TaxID=210409 RepID=A0A5B7K738_PORTR|nr:hypothetical protein [Portunus trituberculatus]